MNEDVGTIDRTHLPRLVFFRTLRPLPTFLMDHLDEQVACLGQWFDVHLVDSPDVDYDEVCESLAPDMCLFESGVYSAARSIRRTWTHPAVPKLGFAHADAFDVCRSSFIADMDAWGVEDFVTTSVSLPEYTPEIADRVFVWPNFVDPATFHRYQVEKSIPVLFTGSQARHYPWRNSIYRRVCQELPTLTSPHFGWNRAGGPSTLPVGEAYARMIAASTFAPACGTITKDLVRKHLEIPAVGTCLVAERTPAMEAAGFRDMVNVVFAEPETVLDKIDTLINDPDLLASITQAGHDLVHERHTVAHRDQIHRWYTLRTSLPPGGRVVQEGPFGDLRVVGHHSRDHSSHVVGDGQDRVLIARAWKHLRRGEADAASRLFRRCLNYYFIPEAVHGLIRSCLSLGEVREAQRWMDRWLTNTLVYNAASSPDPVQWATKIRLDLCQGDLALARNEAREYPLLSHPELTRIRAITLCRESDWPDASPAAYATATVTPLPDCTEDAWVRDLGAELQAAGGRIRVGRSLVDGIQEELPGTSPSVLRRAADELGRTRSFVEGQARDRLRPLHRIFLNGAWERLLSEIGEKEELGHAVVVAPHRFSLAERALRHGLKLNPTGPRILASGTRVTGRRPRRASDVAPPNLSSALGPALLFLGRGAGDAEVDDYTIVVLDDLESAQGQRIFDCLSDRSFELLGQQVVRGRGRAVLRRRDRPDATGRAMEAAAMWST